MEVLARAEDLLEHVYAVPWGVASDDVDLLVYVQPHNVLERDFLVRH